MRVVQVNCAADPNLVDPDRLLDRCRTLTGWSDALAEAGARVRVVQRFDREATRIRNGVHYSFCRRGQLRSAVLRSAADVVHVNGLRFSTCAWWIRRRLPDGAALVIQDHGGSVGAVNGAIRRARGTVRRLGLRAADAFLFVAADQAAPWRAAGLIGPDQPVHELMESGTTFRPIARAVARAATGIEGHPALLWVGRLNANKDPLTVLDGFARALPALPAATLTMIYGEDDLLPRVGERLRETPALEGRVRLVGAVPHESMPSYFSAADLYVCGSHHEGSGYALMEACACGAVPVVTDIPSFRAITHQGAFGALWPPGGGDAFAAALLSVWRRDQAALRSRAIDHAARRLSWRAVGARALSVYAAIVSGRAHARARLVEERSA